MTQKFTLILQGEPCRQEALKHTLRENKTTFRANLKTNLTQSTSSKQEKVLIFIRKSILRDSIKLNKYNIFDQQILQMSQQ